MPIAVAGAAKAAAFVVSAVATTAVVIYASPQVRRFTYDLRHRVALALYSLGDGVQPENAYGEPRFNRPEDAEGFLQSSEVDGDDETKRRQREELLYWNALKLSKELEKQTSENEKLRALLRSGSATTFGEILGEDSSANEKGTYVFNTGAEVRSSEEGLVRRRGAPEGIRGLNAALYANPFADENGIDLDKMEQSHIAPKRDEIVSVVSQDVYNATPQHTIAKLASPPTPPLRSFPPCLKPTSDLIPSSPKSMPDLVPFCPTSNHKESSSVNSVSKDKSASAVSAIEAQDETPGQARLQELNDAYASIQAWAQQQKFSVDSFYSPLPVTPMATLSEMSDAELISEGQMTPTDSGSVAGSGVDVINEATSQKGSSNYGDALSESEDGMATPAHSWTEVGSVVSGSEDGMQSASHA